MSEGEEHPADTYGVLRGEGRLHEQREPEGAAGETRYQLGPSAASLRGRTASRGK